MSRTPVRRSVLLVGAGAVVAATAVSAVIVSDPADAETSATTRDGFAIESLDALRSANQQSAAVSSYATWKAEQDRLAAEAEAARVAAEAEAARVAAEAEAARVAAEAKAAADRAAAAKAASRSAARSAPATPGPIASGSPREIGLQMVLARGWGESQFACLDSIYTRESGWSPSAHNRSSGAHGIPQAMPGSKMASHGSDWETNPATQISWGLSYIAGRYGDPCSAWSFWQSHHWY